MAKLLDVAESLSRGITQLKNVEMPEFKKGEGDTASRLAAVEKFYGGVEKSLGQIKNISGLELGENEAVEPITLKPKVMQGQGVEITNVGSYLVVGVSDELMAGVLKKKS